MNTINKNDNVLYIMNSKFIEYKVLSVGKAGLLSLVNTKTGRKTQIMAHLCVPLKLLGEE